MQRIRLKLIFQTCSTQITFQIYFLDTAQFFVLQVNDANIESEVKTDNTIELLFKHPDENCSHPVPDGYSINSTTDPGVDETAVATASAGVDSCSGSTLRYSG